MLAVHNDKSHLHCHIIFNNTNLYNGLSFTYERNQGKVKDRSWAQLREISDEICKGHGISVISEPEKGHGVSHFERDMQKEGKSWKDKLRIKITEVMLYSRGFKEFLEKCRECGIEYVYKPSNKVKLKFRLSGEGQQRFTRADTLGADFTAERISEQIAEIQEKLSAANISPEMLIEPPKPVAVPKTKPKPTPTVITPTNPTVTPKSNTDRTVITVEEFLAPLYEKPTTTPPAPKPTESQAPEKKEDVWAEIRGMRDADTMIANLEAGGITSLDDLRSFFWNTHHLDDHTNELAELNAKIKPIDKLIKMMKQRSQHYATYKEYQERSAFTQSHFRKKNAAAINAYEEADKYIKEHIKDHYIDGKAPKRSELEALSKELKDKRKALMPEHNAFLRRKAAALQYTRQVRQYLDSKKQQERNRQYQERKRSQQKKKDYLE